MATLSDRPVNTFEIAAPWGKYSPSPFLTEEEKWFYGDTALKGNQDVAHASVPTAPLGICSPPQLSTKAKRNGPRWRHCMVR